MGMGADSVSTQADAFMPYPPARLTGAAGFIHLRVHSAYSLREGAIPVGKLAKLAAADSMPALALTDSNNLFGALEFSEKLAKEGVQPIAGLQIGVDFQDGPPSPRHEANANYPPIALLAMNSSGYANLMHITSRAWLDPQPGEPPHIAVEALDGTTE